MKFTKLDEVRTTRNMVDAFRGYNHNVRISEAEFYDMRNMTSDHYPVLSPRDKRGIYSYATSGTHSCNGIIASNTYQSPTYVDGTRLYLNGSEVTGIILEDSPKHMVMMGAYLIIFPDKKYVNTVNLNNYGDIENSYQSAGTVTYELCREDGTAYSNPTVSSTEPASPADKDLWIDTSSTPHTLKQYAATSSMWVTIPTTFVKIKAAGIADGFAKYDGVYLDNLEPAQLADLNGKASILYDAYHDAENLGAGDYIVVTGIIDQVAMQTSIPITADRRMPEMDFVIESGNRLWGCRYGTANNGQVVNEIYASKLGDFKNWDSFLGISTDSYVASCGTDGFFTGAVTHLGYPLFFKENFLHKVMGNFPSNFQVQTIPCRGVMWGCGDSLAIVNENLFYKSRNGVCVYDGSLPQEISEAFGDIHYTGRDMTIGVDPFRNGARGGSHQNKYYIDMLSEKDSKWYLFVFDTELGVWHKEDEVRIDYFCSCAGELYYVDHSDKLIHTVMGSGTSDDIEFKWFTESGIIGTDSPDKKYISRLTVRMSMALNARVMFYCQYDSCGEWEHVATVTGLNTRTFSLPIRPKRCDHFRLRIEGIGDAKIMSITKTIENGGE